MDEPYMNNKPCGSCLNCTSEVAYELRFCNDACREAYELKNEESTFCDWEE